MHTQKTNSDKDNTSFKDIISLSMLLKKVNPKYRLLTIGLVFGILGTISQLIVPKIIQIIVNQISTGIQPVMLIMIITSFILSIIFSSVSSISLSFFGEDVIAKLRNFFWNKIIKLPISYFDNIKSGELNSRLVNDTSQIKELVAGAFPELINSLLQFFGAIMIMFIMDWKMTAIMLATIPLIMVTVLPFMKKSSHIGLQRQDKLSEFSGISNETIQEIRLVKSSNAEPYESKNGYQLIISLYKTGLKESIYDSIVGPIVSAFMLAVIVGILAYAAIRVMNGTMTIGTMVSFLMYLFQIIAPITSITDFFTVFSKTVGSTKRICEVLEEPEEISISGKRMKNNYNVDNSILKMSNIGFSYENQKPVLKNINITATPNKTIAFIGPSGSGKTTIFNLFERFYEPTEGIITIGGQNIKDLDIHEWRSKIGFVSQESSIMSGTIRHNLVYGLDTHKFSDAKLWQVLKLAYADNFVKEMEHGLDSEIGANGIKLSGGERQRISIAHAFLRNPKILMLDEATASLDSESEFMVQQALHSLMQRRTTLVIAHRLSTIIDADVIYFINHGEVIDSGSHKELLKRLPIYKEYVHRQFKS